MITQSTTLGKLAATVSESQERADFVATLSGGAAVSIYQKNRYLSDDWDFATIALVHELKSALAPIGFRNTGQPRLSVFEHPDTNWYLKFPPAPLSFGGTYVDPSQCAAIDTGLGKLLKITATHPVVDRLIAAVAWNEQQSLDLTPLVAKHQKENIDWASLDQWVIADGIGLDKETIEFYKKIGRQLPVRQRTVGSKKQLRGLMASVST